VEKTRSTQLMESLLRLLERNHVIPIQIAPGAITDPRQGVAPDRREKGKQQMSSNYLLQRDDLVQIQSNPIQSSRIVLLPVPSTLRSPAPAP
jgi:hypothetical protein